MAKAIIMTGGNIGDMNPRLRRAQQLVGSDIGIVLRCSRVYTSKAWGFDAEQEFSNQAMIVDTALSPEELLAALQNIEVALGRNRKAEAAEIARSGQAYTSRAMDIDILFYNDLMMDTPDLVIPHPLLHLRDFVLEPLCEIVPEKIHPWFGISVERLREELLAKTN